MTNQIFFGDNLPILKKMASESVDLIYIDPPFNTKKTQKRTTVKTVRDDQGDRKGFQGNTYRTIELGTKAYEDSFDSLIEFLRPRLIEAYRVLAPHGSLYFHIDYREVHYCKILLDGIFGRECFLNEIIWAYDYGGRARSKWPAKHDNILFYVKNPVKYIFNTGAIDREPYMAPGLVGPEKAKRGKLPTDTWFPRFVGTKEDKTDTWWWESYFGKGSNTAMWQTIIPTSSKERVGYPTQKPLRLINRIINASSLPGSIVLDFFAGSGTVGESCLELKREFVLIDSNKEALEVMAQRFSDVEGIKWTNFDPKPYQNKKIRVKTKSGGKIPSISPEFLMLAATASYLQQDLQENSDLWKDSPFEWILQLPARKKGKLGRELLSSWLSGKEIFVESTKDSSEMLFIKGFRVAIKFSTMWAKGYYRFQQIRSTGYDYIICLGISPLQAHCWVFSKDYAIKNATLQHKDEYWMPINPTNPPKWADGCGGSLEDAYEILNKLKPKNKT